MKTETTFLFALLISSVFTAQGNPAAAARCMGNNDNATTCSACYNWNAGTIGAKQLVGGACTAAVANTIANCRWYNGTINATKALTDCGMCNSQTWLNLTDHAVAANRVMACSDTAVHAATCTTAVANCGQSICFVTAAGAKSVHCRQCATGYKGVLPLTANVGYATCAAMTIANCSLSEPLDTTKCYQCATGHAVVTAGTSCQTFTTDAGCRKLGTGNTYCSQCKNNYYFNLLVCTVGLAQGNPAATAYCSGNNDGLTTCSGCYNYGLGTIGARQLVGGACTAAVANKVTDCKIYNPQINATKALTDCAECNSKTWLNLTDHANAASRIMACSATAVNTGCTTAVTDCQQSVCYVTAAGVASTACRLCNTLKKGSGVLVTNVGYPTCTAGTMTNCSYYDPYDSNKCYICKAGYVLDSHATSCDAYTADANCRQLTASGWCNHCKSNYYFTTTTCTVGYTTTAAAKKLAKIMTVSALIAALLFFFN